MNHLHVSDFALRDCKKSFICPLSLVMLKAPYILLGEDSEDDTFFARRCFAAAGITFKLERCWNGVELCAHLERSDDDLPVAVILDLKMPLMDGFDTLKWIREHPKYSHLPVIILSSSGMLEDRERAEKLRCTEYMVKPNTLAELATLLSDLAQRLVTMAESKSNKLNPSTLSFGANPGTIHPSH
jgi:CheY-like chemotaxis protein